MKVNWSQIYSNSSYLLVFLLFMLSVRVSWRIDPKQSVNKPCYHFSLYLHSVCSMTVPHVHLTRSQDFRERNLFGSSINREDFWSFVSRQKFLEEFLMFFWLFVSQKIMKNLFKIGTCFFFLFNLTFVLHKFSYLWSYKISFVPVHVDN